MTMETLPMEIVENILSRLATEEALPAKQVCTTWRSFLCSKTDKVGLLFAESRPGFFNVVYQFYYGDEYQFCYGDEYGRKKMVYTINTLFKQHNGQSVPWVEYFDGMLGSCNGLVCFQRQYPVIGNRFLICNPLTGEVVYTPETKAHKWKYRTEYWQRGIIRLLSGFGYCHSTNEYKIVRMYYKGQHCQPRKVHVKVYTVRGGGGGKWRNKGSIHIYPPVYEAGVYANGALHWLHQCNYSDDKDNYTITAFNLEDEKFHSIPMPHFGNANSMYRRPKLLGGSNLYLVYTSHKPYCTDIWAYKRKDTNTTCDLKENYNDKSSWHWINEFKIEWEEAYWKDLSYFEPMAITRNGELLLRHDTYNAERLFPYESNRTSCVRCYDLKTSKMNEPNVPARCNMISVTPHANSTVSISLKGGRYRGSLVKLRKSFGAWMS